MYTKKQPLLIALLSTCLLASVTFTSCNNDGEKKEPESVKTDAPISTMADSPKMNVAPVTTEPSKMDTPTKKMDTIVSLKKAGKKPVTTKPAVPPPAAQ